MAPIDITQLISSPAWSGAWTAVGVITTTAISLISLKKSHESQPQVLAAPRTIKK